MKLFIDDQREPTYAVDKIARTSQEAIDWIKEFGMPNFISFDHDLGWHLDGNRSHDDTAMQVVDWIAKEWFMNRLDIPADFSYHVHSQNPVGVANIKRAMENLLKYARKDEDS
jgi:hypothetical protein